MAIKWWNVISVSVSAETEVKFRYRFRLKWKMAFSVIFGIGRNEKSPFGHTLFIAILLQNFIADTYAPIIEQSQLVSLHPTKSWRLKCKYSPSAFSSLLMQLPPQIGVRILQRPLLSIEASRANILFCFSNLYSSKISLKKRKVSMPI